MTQSPNWVLWNLFLAFVPVVMAMIICTVAEVGKNVKLSRLLIAALGVVWLAFLPNACYLLTEWRHFLFGLDGSNLYLQSQLDGGTRLRLMVYTVFYFCYSGAGMLAFTLAVRPVARLAKRRGATLWVHGIWLFLLCSLGVYLGLKPRFNSWDFAAKPGEIWGFIVAMGRDPRLISFIVAFGAFLWIAYWAIDIWIDGFTGRYRELPRK